MRILGIETSCDETGAAVIEAAPGDKTVRLLSNVVASSLSLHAKTGGIIPEIAAREQLKYIIPVLEQALKEAGIRHSGEEQNDDTRITRGFWTSQNNNINDIDTIAVTVGPGLIGPLLVGVETAKTLAYVWKKPIIPVNHLIGHIYANFIEQPTLSLRAKRGNLVDEQSASSFTTPRNDNIEFPTLALIVSGGHTDLVLMRNHGSIKWIGGTRDDAAGEAFDKIGRLLNLPYPGGPAIAKAAEKGDSKAFNFPRPMMNSDDFDFSFSGLKTAVLRETQKLKLTANDLPAGRHGHRLIADLSASVQQAIVDVLVAKTMKAAQEYKVKSILLSGGVAANQQLHEQMKLEIGNWKLEINLHVPHASLCTDNAAMIATSAFFNLVRKDASSAYKPVSWQEITAYPSLHFDTHDRIDRKVSQ